MILRSLFTFWEKYSTLFKGIQQNPARNYVTIITPAIQSKTMAKLKVSDLDERNKSTLKWYERIKTEKS